MKKRPIATIMIIIFTVPVVMFLALRSRENATLFEPGMPLLYATVAPSPTSTPLRILTDDIPDPAYAAAQATLAAGQNEIMELSHQATLVSLDKDQAANAAAQATLDYNQRQLMELSIQGTEISQNMAWAAATQQFITEQTQMAENAKTTAQSQAATAAYSASVLNVTQAAQAQAILDFHVVETAQANATLRAYSLTATPWAALQADIVRTQNESERRDWWRKYVITPIKIILITLAVLLFIAGGVKAYQWLLLDLRLRAIWCDNDKSLLLVDGTIVNPDPPYYPITQLESHLPNPAQLMSDGTTQVEIISPSETSIINWIKEAEQELRKMEGYNHEF